MWDRLDVDLVVGWASQPFLPQRSQVISTSGVQKKQNYVNACTMKTD